VHFGNKLIALHNSAVLTLVNQYRLNNWGSVLSGLLPQLHPQRGLCRRHDLLHRQTDIS